MDAKICMNFEYLRSKTKFGCENMRNFLSQKYSHQKARFQTYETDSISLRFASKIIFYTESTQTTIIGVDSFISESRKVYFLAKFSILGLKMLFSNIVRNQKTFVGSNACNDLVRINYFVDPFCCFQNDEKCLGRKCHLSKI